MIVSEVMITKKLTDEKRLRVSRIVSYCMAWYPPHSITHVNEKNQRVTLLLKESFLGSFTNSEHSNFGGGHTGAGNFHGANTGLSGGFSTNEREFMEMFVDTQMFNAYSDSIFLQQQTRT